ncbi:MAG: hypothetical protein C4297_12745 [Gemmataceae bacterium]
MANVRHFGAAGDGTTDDTDAFEHALQEGDGLIEVPRGDYVLTRPLVVPLDKLGRFSLSGLGGQGRLVMRAAGPAVHLLGTHAGTADPTQVSDRVWSQQRFPHLEGIEIVGAHEQADGIRLEGTMQATLARILIRRCRVAIHLVRRNRNVIVDSCHIYHSRRLGIWLDGVNMHQINIHGCHISYCPAGGIRVERSEVRNVQICSNDIEYNYDAGLEDCADVLLDARQGTIREGTMVGNTIQARESKGGANVRMLAIQAPSAGAVGMWTIAGNLLGSQETVLHLVGCRGVTLTGNALYSGYRYALLAQQCQNLIVCGNSIDRNSDYPGPSTDQVAFEDCRQVVVQGTVVEHAHPGGRVEASVTLHGCENVLMTGCQILAARRRGLLIGQCRHVRIADCIVRAPAKAADYLCAAEIQNADATVSVSGSLDKGTLGDVVRSAGQ